MNTSLEEELAKFAILDERYQQVKNEWKESKQRIRSLKRASSAPTDSRERTRQARYQQKFRCLTDLEDEVSKIRKQCEDTLQSYRILLVYPDPLLHPAAFETLVEQGRPVKAKVSKSIVVGGKERMKLLQRENSRYKRELLKWLTEEKIRLTNQLELFKQLLIVKEQGGSV